MEIRDLLLRLGEDLNREGLIETPERVAKAWCERLSGYEEDPEEILSKQFENEDEPGALHLCENVHYVSTCEHHLLPFEGYVSIAYLPDENVVGLSKLARLVQCYAKRLQIQERMTKEIAEAITQHLEPIGVAVVVSGRHLCCVGRGVRQKEMSFVTTTYRGNVDLQILQTMTLQIKRS